MSALSDDTIRRVFTELQNKLVESNRQVQGVQAQLQGKAREKKLAELTKREIDGLDAETKTYRPVGKMFIQTPLKEMQISFTEKIVKLDEDTKELEKSQKYWERAAVDAQGNLRDILGGPRRM